jgi:hypothetical protein
MLALVTTNIILNNITVSSRFSYQAVLIQKKYIKKLDFFLKFIIFNFKKSKSMLSRYDRFGC